MRSYYTTLVVFLLLCGAFSLQSGAFSNLPVEWNNQYLTSDSSIYDIIKTKDDNYIATGYLNDDIILFKIDSNGTILWQQTWGTNEQERAFKIIETNDNGFLVVGDVLTVDFGFNIIIGKFNETGTEEWSQTFGGVGDTRARSVIQTKSNDFLIVGYSNENERGDFDIYIKKISETGEELLTRLVGDTGNDFGFDIIENTNKTDSFMIAASSNSFNNDNNMDFFLAEININLIPQWYNVYEGTGQEDLYSIIQTNDNGFALIGTTQPVEINDWDTWVVKTNEEGKLEWKRSITSKEEQNTHFITQTSNDDYLIGGYHKNIVSYDPVIYHLNSLGYVKKQYSIDTYNETLLDRYPDELSYSVIYDTDHLIFGGRLEALNGVICSIIKSDKIDSKNGDNLYPIAETIPYIETSVNEDIRIESNGIDADGHISLYRWDVDGDGIFDYESTTNKSITHTFRTPGNYTAVFQITDNNGNTAIARTAIQVKSLTQSQIDDSNTIQQVIVGLILILLSSFILIHSEIKYHIRERIKKSPFSKIFFFLNYSTWTQNLIYTMILMFTLKIIIGFFYNTPDVFFDELSYVITAKDISQGQLSLIGNQWFTHGYPAGYSFLLSPAYLLGDNIQVVYQGLLLINIFLSVCILIPSYLISRIFIKEKFAYLTAIIIATLPAVTGHSFMMMTEVTFMLFFLISCFFIIKVYTYQKNDLCFYLLSFTTGLLVAFLVLIRITGIAMFPALIAVFVYFVYKKRTLLSLRYGVTLLPFLPALVYVLSSGESKTVGYDVSSYISRFLSNFVSIESFTKFINLLFNEFLYFSLMSYLLFMIFTIFLILNWKNVSTLFTKKTDHFQSFSIYGLLSIFMLMIITVVHIQKNFNLYTRYVLPGLPIFFILGIIGIYYFVHTPSQKNIKYLIAISILISLITVFLFPLNGFKIINNVDIFWILERTDLTRAIRNQFYLYVQSIILILFLPTISFLLYQLMKKGKNIEIKKFTEHVKQQFNKKFIYIFLITLGISLMISVPVSQYTYNLDNAIYTATAEPGQFLNDLDPGSTVAIDDIQSAFSGGAINEGIDWQRFIVATTFWHGKGTIEPLNKTSIITLIDNTQSQQIDYVISTHDLTDFFQRIKSYKFQWETNEERKQNYIDVSIYKIS